MDQFTTFDDVLREFVAMRELSDGRLAKLSGLPKGTIKNWLKGVTKSPRHWQDIIRVADALLLDVVQVNALLEPTKHPSLADLWTRADEADKALFKPWAKQLQSPAPTAPFQVPPDIAYFVGRTDEIEAIQERVLAANGDAIYTLQGMGGVGKTALAIRLAYQLRPHFPDGVLWARVDTSNVMTTLNTFAGAYGEDVTVYSDVDSRSRFVRNILGKKHALIVLDNVESSQQIQPLLPPTTSRCTVLLTTRYRNLTAVRGLPRLVIRPFSEQQEASLALFARILEGTQQRYDQADLLQIAERLGHLPLALAIAAGRLAYEPTLTAADLLELLSEQEMILDVVEDEGQSVRAFFEMSYSSLPAMQKWIFGVLGVFSGEDFSDEAVAYVTNMKPAVVKSHLAKLCTLSLVQARHGRYALHSLVRSFACEKLEEEGAWERYVSYFTDYVATHAQNFAALDKEASNIFAAIDIAYEKKLKDPLLHGIGSFCRFLTTRGLDDLAMHHLRRAQEMVKLPEDTPISIEILGYIGNITERHGHLGEAEGYYEEALRQAYQLEEPRLIARMLQQMGRVIQEQKAFERAEQFLRESLALARKNGFPEVTCTLLNSLGALFISRYGNYAEAEKLYRDGLQLAQANQFVRPTCLFLINLGGIMYRRGDYTAAERYFEDCQLQAEAIGYQLMLGVLQLGQGWLVMARAGDWEQARYHLHKGIEMVQALEQRMYGRMLAELGGVAMRQGQLEEAEADLQKALHIAGKTGEVEIAILAYTYLGQLAGQRERHDQAETYFEEALLLARQYQDAWHLGRALQGWGEWQLSLAVAQDALKTFTELHTVAQRAGFAGLSAIACYRLGQAHALTGKWSRAKQLGAKGAEELQELGHYLASEAVAWGETVSGS